MYGNFTMFGLFVIEYKTVYHDCVLRFGSITITALYDEHEFNV
jgi:hypothetical protein